MPAIAKGIRTEERALAIQPTPTNNKVVSVKSIPIANVVNDAHRIFACFSVGGGNVIINLGLAQLLVL